ncbi:hypothetical protein EUBVEN_02367 [Eubacterium ventriosum ATCC 27560]|uniref:Uncharacterized protein n=1 Tax=Eubacterium ventriosum ATCC 27560 TaxID=411463 RepID=A5Z9H2_9FIRM|nr:hypothetical protein EUBVEN_02367 [Eubacterium ventriosum ATCC 27560]
MTLIKESSQLRLVPPYDKYAPGGNRTRIFVSGGRRSIHYTTGTTS